MTASNPARPHIMLVATEESGDRLGASLIQAIRQRILAGVQFSGVGGRHMAAQGVVSPFPIDDLAIVGLAAIPAKFFKILQRINQTAQAIVAARPDVLVIIDSPDFTHRVARRVRAWAPEIPIVDYVSPSVWAWRPGRARAMRRYVDHVLALLPFEPEVHQRLGGPRCSFVGHPVSERAATLRPNAEEAKRRDGSPPVLIVMPGSRTTEVRRMLPVFEHTVAELAKASGPIEVVMPTIDHLAGQVRTAIASWSVPVRVVSDQPDKDKIFRIARAALVKSGTGTLELAIAGVPMVAAYRGSWIEAAILRPLISTPSVILANLVLGENVVPEFLQDEADPLHMAKVLLPLLGDGPERRRQIDAFRRLDSILEIGKARPSERAATIVLELAGR